MNQKEENKEEKENIWEVGKKMIIPEEGYRYWVHQIETTPPIALQRFNEYLIVSLIIFVFIEFILIQPTDVLIDPLLSPIPLVIIGIGFCCLIIGIIKLSLSVIPDKSKVSSSDAFLWAFPLIALSVIGQIIVIVFIPFARVSSLSFLNLSLYLIGFCSMACFEFGIANLTVGMVIHRC
ncbi:MAG: hypothetical protein ACTSUV_07035 [Candidatus Ranarchaeia archaeon]